jgi:spore germination protein YaaH
MIVTVAVTAVLALPAGIPSARGADDQVLGGWFGNWHPPSVVADRMAAGKGSLTDAAVFAWAFGGSANPVCSLSPKSACLPADVTSTPQLRRSIRSMGDKTVWVSHVDINYARARELAALLKMRAQRRALIDLLVQRTVAVGADGLDLDWENFAFNDGSSTWASTRPVLNRTVRALAARLHAQGKLLSVTVPVGSAPYAAAGVPKIGSGYTVFDWRRLAAAADRLNLMAYDFSYSAPGPIGPHWWAKSAVSAAKRAVGPENARKVIVGVPLYGKSWPTPGAGGQAVVGECPAGWRPKSVAPTFSLGAIDAAALAADKGVRPRYDRRTAESTFTYAETVAGTYRAKVRVGKKRRTVTRSADCAVSRTVWFGNGSTVARRAAMARRRGIGGVFAWNLANADNSLFQRYSAQSR